MPFTTGVGQILANVHPKDKCQGWCVIHNPAPGPWDTWPTQWRGDQTVKIETVFGPIWMPVDIWRGFERNCPHGIGHTAVEEVLRGNGHPHGCDGCPCGPQHMQATGYDPKAVDREESCSMRKGTRIGLIAGGIIVVIALIFLCSAMFRGNAAPAPQTTVTPVVQETKDCDDEDRANREIEDCGIGVLLDPGKSTKPVATTKPPVTRCTKIPARKC